MIKAVILDFDDTLIYTYLPSVEHLQKTADMIGLEKPSEGTIKRHWGKSWKDFVKGLWPFADVDDVTRSYNDILGEVRAFPPVEGVHEVLSSLSGSHVIGLLTSRDRKNLPERARQAEIDLEIFDFVVTADDVGFLKPDPRVFEDIISGLERQDIKRDEIVYVGDNITDLMASRGAGLHFLAVLTGTTTKEEFLQAGLEEKHIMDSVAQLIERLKYF